VKDALPIIEVLLAEREIEPVSMARSLEIGDGETFTEHLLNWVSGDEVDQEEDERDDEPDHWQGVEDAGGEVAEQGGRRLLAFTIAGVGVILKVSAGRQAGMRMG